MSINKILDGIVLNASIAILAIITGLVIFILSPLVWLVRRLRNGNEASYTRFTYVRAVRYSADKQSLPGEAQRRVVGDLDQQPAQVQNLHLNQYGQLDLVDD